MLFAGRDAQEPMAMGEVFIGKAALFGAEEKGDAAGGEALPDDGCSLLQALDGMLRAAAPQGGGADDEGAVGDGFRDGLEFFGAGQEGRRAHRGTGFAKGKFVGVDYAKVEEAEVTHGAGGSADVERVAWRNEDDVEAVGLGWYEQGRKVYRRKNG
jgi:hypothetical protein